MMRRVVWLIALAACGDDDSGSGGDGGTGSIPPNNGFVLVSAYNALSNGAPIMGGSVSATFSLDSSTSVCTTQTVGRCTLYMCPQTPPPVTYASSGTVTILGLSQSVVLAPSTDKTYPPYSTQSALLSGGENLTIRSTGADAPAFMLTFTAPARASITMPAKPAVAGSSITIDRSGDFPVAWTGGGAGEVYVVIGSNAGYSMTCEFAASAGSGTIPAAALSLLTAGSGTFSASSVVLKSTDMGDWRVTGEAFLTAVWATDQSIAGVTATLQ
jgi:hypothetical protein